MRIAVWHNLPSGGGKRALYDHVAGLLQRGHHVESWCPPTADQTYLPLTELCQETIVPLQASSSTGRSPMARVLSPLRDMEQRLEAMDRHCRSCAEAINRGGFDLLFANACTFFRVTSIGQHVSLPSVLYLQEPYRPLYEALPCAPWAARPANSERPWSAHKLKTRIKDIVAVEAQRLQVREEVRNAGAFSLILVNSLFSRESLLRAYGRESRVCYLGIDVERFSPTGESSEDYVVSVGGFSYIKAAERVISALAEVPETLRPPLIWVGNYSDPEYADAIQCQASRSGVKLKLHVGIADKQLVSILSRARAMIYAPRLEPFGLAPLEANACGIPVIGVSEGGLRETIQSGVNGLLAQSADSKEFSSLIRRLLESPELQAGLRASARPHVLKSWTLEHAAQRLESALTATVTNR